MRIVTAVSRFPFPVEKGDKLRVFHQLRYLNERHKVTLVALCEKMPSDEGISEVKKICNELHIVKVPVFFRYWRLLLSFITPAPFQVNYFRSFKMKRLLNKIIRKESPDILYVQLLRLGKNIPYSNQVPRYIDFMDAFAEGMRKRYRFSKWYEKPFVAVEAVKLNRYQRSLAYKYDGYSVISRQDKLTFSPEVQVNMDVIANGVDESFLRIEKQPLEFDLLFTGNMGYHPNIQACKYLVKKICPLLRKRGLNVKVCLAGARPAQEVQELAGENVVVTGYVPDIKKYLASSGIFVAPLFSGSGLQNKLLESMAAGMPTVTTTLTNNALGGEAGVNIMIADSAGEFADKIEILLKNAEMSMKLGESARCFIQENYRWETCNRKLEQKLLEVAGKVIKKEDNG